MRLTQLQDSLDVYEGVTRKTKTVIQIKKVSSWQLNQQLQRFFS